MTKIKNRSIYSDDADYLKFLADELQYLGRPYILDLKGGRVIQLARPPVRVKKKRDKREDREPRNKRAESAARKA